MDRKQRIENNFSKASKTYNSSTPIQKLSAETVAKILKSKPKGKILEIGAGTGYLSELLIEKYKDNEIIINDISESMIEELQANIELPDNLSW